MENLSRHDGCSACRTPKAAKAAAKGRSGAAGAGTRVDESLGLQFGHFLFQGLQVGDQPGSCLAMSEGSWKQKIERFLSNYPEKD